MFARSVLLTLSLFTAMTATAAGDHSNFRVSTGVYSANLSNGPQWMPDNDQMGFAVFAEFPQSNIAASRFILYRVNGEDGLKLQGGETQLMWGWGLADTGPRIYTGPTWHYEKMQVQRGNSDHFRVFNGWGWQLGVGYQLRAITLDYAFGWHDNQDYNDENSYAGTKDGDYTTQSLLLSYRF